MDPRRRHRCARRRARGRCPRASGGHARAAARCAPRREGHHRRGRPADDGGRARVRAYPSVARCDMCRAPARGRRRRARQDPYDAVRLPRSGADDQRVECRPHARRLLVGLRRRRRRAPGAGGPRLPDGRVDLETRGLQRRRRPQGHERARAARGRRAPRLLAGSHRAARALGRGRRTRARRDGGALADAGADRAAAARRGARALRARGARGAPPPRERGRAACQGGRAHRRGALAAVVRRARRRGGRHSGSRGGDPPRSIRSRSRVV